jgi:two-component system, chemotaxis family, CheB/CheR fusion protein
VPVARAPHPAGAATGVRLPTIFIVDDDSDVRAAMRAALKEAGRNVEAYPTCETFLEGSRPGRGACLLIDA